MTLPRTSVHPAWLLLAWLLLNLVQAALSPLDADETYYWMYASDLDWGYFDHPPAVALLISLGRDWLPGALGLRLGHVLAGTLTMAAAWHLLDKPRGELLWLAAALLFAQPMLQVYGFIATPDGPLLLFTVLYLLAYRRFLDRPDWTAGALWGLTMAGLLYSKYHGVVLIAFSVLPFVGRLIRQPAAWLAAIGGALLYLPHLYWQWANDFPSFRYHLSGRDDAYQFKYTTEYVLNQLVIFNPLLLYYYFQTFYRDRSYGRFARACRWLIVVFLLFFLYSTSKGGTEAQWTALLALPLVYLVYTSARDRFPGWRGGIWRVCLLGGALLLVGRLALMAPREWLPFTKPFDHQPWVERLAERADGLPVIIENSYRYASLYEFYSGGRPAYTYTNVAYRLNQYDLWAKDSVFHNRRVLLAGQGNWNYPAAVPFRVKKHPDDLRTAVIDRFPVAKGVRLLADRPWPDRLMPGSSYPLRVSAVFPGYFSEDLHLRDAALPIDLFAILHFPDERMSYWRLGPLATDRLTPGDTTLLFDGTVLLPEDTPAGAALLELGLGYEGMPPIRGQIGKETVIVADGRE